jgi:hypothetical protein
MFWFHQDRPEAGHGGLRVRLLRIFPTILWKKAQWKFCEGEMEIAFGGLIEDPLSEGGGGLGSARADGPEDDVELRRRCGGEEVRGFGEALMEFERGGVAGFEALREGSAGGVRE